jgi:hypothetical protein
LVNIAHAACSDLLRDLHFVFWMSHDIFISRESLSVVAIHFVFLLVTGKAYFGIKNLMTCDKPQ